jgi:predicted nucleotidyltransferase
MICWSPTTSSSKRRGTQVERESATWRCSRVLPATLIARLRLGIPSRCRERVVDEAIIDEAGRRLSGAAPPGTRFILFGSHARGEAGKHSDLDFLVIEPEVENAAEESVRLRGTLRGLLLAADVIVASEQRVRDWRDVKGSLIHAALAEGRELAA